MGMWRVQLEDVGRVRCVLKFHGAAPAMADTLLTLTKNLGGVETTATSHGVTAGKRLRITAIAFSVRSNAALAAAFATMNLRHAAGAVSLASPSLLRLDLGHTEAAVGGAKDVVVPVPDGLEFSGADQIGVSLAAQATTNIISIALLGFEYVP